MPGFLGGLEGLVNRLLPNKKGSTVLLGAAGVAATAIASGVLIHQLQRRRFAEEWNKAEARYPKVVVIHHSNPQAADVLKSWLLNPEWREDREEYGVVVVSNREDIPEALSYVKAGAVLYDRSLREREVRMPDGSSLPMIKAPSLEEILRAESRGTARQASERMEKKITGAMERRKQPFYEILRRVADYFESSEGREGFAEAREDIAKMLGALVKSGQPLDYVGWDSHRGGGFAVTYSGRPIDKSRHYDRALFMKREEGSIARYIEDDAFFNSPQRKENARFARPFAYANMADGGAVAVMEGITGPMLAYVFSSLMEYVAHVERRTQKELRPVVNEIILRTMSAYFSEAADYHVHHALSTKMDKADKRVAAVVEHYKDAGWVAYRVLRPLMQEAGVDEKGFEYVLSAFELPELGNPEMYRVVMDLSLRNARIRTMRIELPDIDEIFGFYIRKGRVVSEAEIRGSLGIYDIGYTEPEERHLVDEFGRAAFSAYLGGLEETDWIRLARSYVEKEISARAGAKSGSLESLLKHIAALRRQTSKLPPDVFVQNLYGVGSFRFLRFVEDSVNAAMKNEESLAKGDIKPSEYGSNRGLYVGNASIYLRSWFLFSLSGALFFRNNTEVKSYPKVWKELGEAWKEAREKSQQNGLEHEMESMAADSGGFWGAWLSYSALAAYRMWKNPEALERMLKEEKERAKEFGVEFYIGNKESPATT